MAPMTNVRTHPSSGLFYATGEEVRLGDRVILKRLFGRDIEGVVSYIPGISPKHEDLEYEDVRQWAIRSNDGSVFPILYDPERFQPPKKIRFLSRGYPETIAPGEPLN